MTLILPPKYETKLFVPVPEWEWRTPSHAVAKDSFGLETKRTRFQLTARLDDGHIRWRGHFESRDDADAFTWALVNDTLRYERRLWDLPTPHWHPDLDEGVHYEFLTQTFFTGTSASTQTTSTPSDWNNSNNTIEVVSHAGTAAAGTAGPLGGGGGSSGGYAKSSNVTLSGTITYNLDVAGGGTTDTDATWFNGANLAASSVGIRGGSNASTTTGGTGAVTTNAIGTTKTAGGNGGNGSGAPGGSGGGGGGAPGPGGAAAAGAAASGFSGGNGGAANGGSPTGGAHASPGTAGTAGTAFDATHGPGSGGGGADSGGGVGGNGGNYGAGAGGGAGPGSAGGTSRPGVIYLAYTPAISPERSTRGLTRGVVNGSYH